MIHPGAAGRVHHREGAESRHNARHFGASRTAADLSAPAICCPLACGRVSRRLRKARNRGGAAYPIDARLAALQPAGVSPISEMELQRGAS